MTAGAFLASIFSSFGATTAVAQLLAPVPKAAAPAAKAPAQPAAPRVVRSETTTHDFWIVACDHFDPPATQQCAARMPVYRSGDMKQVLLVTSISKGPNDQWFFNLHVPTSIAVQPGVELRFGDKPARKLAVQSCEPALCTASAPLDATLRAELTGAQKATAVWKSIANGDIKADFPLKGANSALATLIK